MRERSEIQSLRGPCLLVEVRWVFQVGKMGEQSVEGTCGGGGGGDLVTQSCPTLVTPWTVALQAPLSMGFPR